MHKLRWAFALVLALVGLQISAATAATSTARAPDPPPAVVLETASGPPPLIAPSIQQRMNSKAGKKLRLKVGDQCAKKWLAKTSYWSADALLCGGIGIVSVVGGLVCATGMFVSGEFIDYDRACD